MPIRIRRGVKEDIRTVYHMIWALAASMGDSVGPDQTIEDLIRDAGFDPENPMEPFFIAFMAEEYDVNGSVPPNIIGYSTVTPPRPSKYGRTMVLVNLYVANEHRNRGVGRLMMAETARFGRENGVTRYIFSCYNCNPAMKFYERLGASNYTQRCSINAILGKLRTIY